MNRQPSEAIARVQELPEDRQQAAAALLLDCLDRDRAIELTPEQVAETERRLAENDIAADQAANAFFDRLKI